jgi:cobalt-zinc-cadmium resistance protein CzcA
VDGYNTYFDAEVRYRELLQEGWQEAAELRLAAGVVLTQPEAAHDRCVHPFSLTQRLMLLLLAAALVIAGLWGFRTLPIDAFPDITSPQVQVIAKAPGMAPSEVETRITFPLEREMQGLPRQTVLRSTTKYALAVIVLDFEDGTDIYWARNQVAERLNQVRASLPANAEVGLAPITTPLSELYMYRIEGGGLSNAELRAVQDWVIRPRLRTVAGVADVNSLGGEVRAFEVAVQPERLARYGLGLDEVEQAIEASNRNAGGDRINRQDQTLLVRTIGALQTLDDVRAVTVATPRRAGARRRCRRFGFARSPAMVA